MDIKNKLKALSVYFLLLLYYFLSSYLSPQYLERNSFPKS